MTMTLLFYVSVFLLSYTIFDWIDVGVKISKKEDRWSNCVFMAGLVWTTVFFYRNLP